MVIVFSLGVVRYMGNLLQRKSKASGHFAMKGGNPLGLAISYTDI